MLRSLWFAVLCCVGLCLARPVAAQTLEPPSHVFVLTMGPGEHPFTRFGHNALLLEWDGPGAQRDAVYNFGTFEFDGLRGVRDFMAGRFRYWLSVSNLQTTLAVYGAEHRSLTAQELELTRAERAALATALVENARPEHRYYAYDYYLDNCSTRVRDALDRVLSGALSRRIVGPGRLSFRQHTLRLVAGTPWLYFGLDLALGARSDRPTSRYQELFLPQELHAELGRAWRKLGGRSLPLVRAERVLLPAARPTPPALPPERRALYALSGALLGALLAALGRSAGRARAPRRLFGALSVLFAASLGVVGCALLLLACSKHWAAHANPSLWLCPPWLLLLLLPGVRLVACRRPSRLLLLGPLGEALASSSAVLCWALISGNGEALRPTALFLPLWAGFFVGALLATREHAEPRQQRPFGAVA